MRLFSLIALFLVAFPYISFAQGSCDYKVEILVNNSEFESKDFSWRMRATKIEGPSTNITGTAEIQDSNGQIIRKYRPWTNAPISKQKTSSEYTPNLNQGEYKIISRINVGCDDTDKNSNADARIIRINNKNNEINAAVNQNKIIDSNINDAIKKETINQTTSNKTSENKSLPKNESKQPIASEEDNIIQLKNPNKNNQNSQEPQMAPYAVKNQETIYESSNEKAKNLIVAFLLALSVLLNIVLIWKR